jgi:hypothetical protein
VSPELTPPTAEIWTPVVSALPAASAGVGEIRRTTFEPAQRRPSPKATPAPPPRLLSPWKKIIGWFGTRPEADSNRVSLLTSALPEPLRLAPFVSAELPQPLSAAPLLPQGPEVGQSQ